MKFPPKSNQQEDHLRRQTSSSVSFSFSWAHPESVPPALSSSFQFTIKFPRLPCARRAIFNPFHLVAYIKFSITKLLKLYGNPKIYFLPLTEKGVTLLHSHGMAIVLAAIIFSEEVPTRITERCSGCCHVYSGFANAFLCTEPLNRLGLPARPVISKEQ